MQMISYWKEVEEFYIDEDGLVLIMGRYNHKNLHKVGSKALGIHWGDYPQSRGILSPCVIPSDIRNAMLSGLLCQATLNNDSEKIQKILKAIKFFNSKDEE